MDSEYNKRNLIVSILIFVTLFIIVAIVVGTTLLKKPSYTVTFYGSGGELIKGREKQVIKQGESALPPEYERLGYAFTGWSDEFDNIKEEKVIYATWQVLEYTILFNSKGGSNINPITTNFGRAVEQPHNPIRYGYEFDGWYLDDETFEELFSFYTMPAENLTLYAKWIVKKYKVLFDGQGGLLISGLEEQMVQHGEAAVAPEYIREGYTFIKWDTDFDNVTADTLIKAEWEEILEDDDN